MKTNKFKKSILGLGVILLTLASCGTDLDDTTYFTSDTLNIVETLEADSENYSMYVEVLQKTGFYSTLQSYGSYTCFVPNNEAFKDYILNKWGATTIEELDSDQIDDLTTIVKFHTLPKKRNSTTFIEGRMQDTTYTGDVLTTSYLGGGGIANILINRNVNLGTYDIDTSNGIIHELKGVLEPYADPVSKKMEDGGQHNIFIEALKLTDIYDKLELVYDENDNFVRKMYTIYAETDEVYSGFGINTLDDLIKEISPDNDDYTNVSNDLNRYVAYHITEGSKYLADLEDSGTYGCILENNAIVTTRSDKELRINEDTTADDSLRSWTQAIAEDSNYPAKNGVYHSVDRILNIFLPPAVETIFDLCDQEEYALTSSHTTNFTEFYEKVDWSPNIAVRWIRQSNKTNYDNNHWDFGAVAYIEFITPTIAVGEYELLISANMSKNGRAAFQLFWDGEPIGSTYNLKTRTDNLGFPDDLITLESNGWRPGYGINGAEIENNAGEVASDNWNQCQFIITKNLLCPVQKTHVLRLETITAGAAPLDYLHFIPINQ